MMEMFTIKSGPFYLSRFPVKGQVSPFGGDLYDSLAEADRELASLRLAVKDGTAEQMVLAQARVVRLVVTESEV